MTRCDVYIENSKAIIAEGSESEQKSAVDTLYTALDGGLRLIHPFMYVVPSLNLVTKLKTLTKGPLLRRSYGSAFHADPVTRRPRLSLPLIQSIMKTSMIRLQQQHISYCWNARGVSGRSWQVC